MGIIAGALGGLGEAAIGAGRQLGDYASRSAIQAEAAAIAKERDARLQEYAVSMERDVRQPFQRSEREGAQAFTGAENEKGRTFQRSMETDVRQPFQRAENEANRGLERDRLTEQSRHNKANEGIQAQAASRAQALLDEQIKNMGLERTVKQLQVEQAQETRKYRDLATNEKDPAKRAEYREVYQLLTGKDNDNFVITPDKTVDEFGKETVNGVIKTDRRTGKVTYESIAAIQRGGAPDGATPKPKLDYGYIHPQSGYRYIGKPGDNPNDKKNWAPPKAKKIGVVGGTE